MVHSIRLPGDYHFLFIESHYGNPRVIINYSDIKAIELSHIKDELLVKIIMFDTSYSFTGQDALDIEEFFVRQTSLTSDL